MISIDTFTNIGSKHTICQDYIVKNDQSFPFIILSDGCSASENTDIGARIICHIAKQYLKREGLNFKLDYRKTGDWIIYNAEMVVSQLGLNRSCLDATLIIAYCDESIHTARVMTYGDGSIIRKARNGEIRIMTTSFHPNNAPYYLSYRIDEVRDQIYHEAKNENHLTLLTSYDKYKPSVESFAYDVKNDILIATKELQYMFICSDGVDSFLDANKNPVKIEKLVDTFTDIKTKKGSYLQRTMNRKIRDFNKEGITHYDDLSIGSFLFSEE